MFKYVYSIECGKSSQTCRWGEKSWFEQHNIEAEYVNKEIKNILSKVKENWYWDSYLTIFRITRHLVSDNFHWHSKVIFEWKNPDYTFL